MNHHIIDLGSAIVFVVLPFFGSRTRAAWSRWLYFTIAGLFLFKGAIGLSLDSHFWELSEHGQSVYEHWLSFIRGFILGCIFALIVSGNIKGKTVFKDEAVA
jgi:hypothetical protein